jgi:hypothetical protein
MLQKTSKIYGGFVKVHIFRTNEKNVIFKTNLLQKNIIFPVIFIKTQFLLFAKQFCVVIMKLKPICGQSIF